MSRVEEEGELDSLISLSFIEGLYEEYVRDPDSIPADWRTYFDHLEEAQGSSNGDGNGAGHGDGNHNGNGHANGHLPAAQIGPSFKSWSIFNPPTPITTTSTALRLTANGPPSPAPVDMAVLQDRVDQLVRAYRVRGHIVAELDPLGTPRTSESTVGFHTSA